MRPRHYFLCLVVLAAGLSMGYKIGVNGRDAKQQREMRILSKQLERFTNRQVFEHARYVAEVTGTPLYQVLTGNRVSHE